MTRFSLCLLALVGCSTLPDDTASQDTDTGDTDTSAPNLNCEPPARLDLASIPDDAALSDVSSNVQAVFEVDGDDLVAKYVRDPAVGEGALDLWQELVLRIPTNQRTQLVQFTLYNDSGLAGYVDNSGVQNVVGRAGPSLFLHTDNITDNAADPCAPLSGRRGTYDWTLIHEFSHLRQYADGSIDDYIANFGTNTGPGEGYPEDGSPRTDGTWVSSYAERAGGDEDTAESFTAWVMLADRPTEQSIAAIKVNWFYDQPGYVELRDALRVSEGDHQGLDVPAAPLASFGVNIDNPDWLIGEWTGSNGNGTIDYSIASDDVIVTFTDAIGSTTVQYSDFADGDQLGNIRVIESNSTFHFLQVAYDVFSYSISFHNRDGDISLEHERYGAFELDRVE